MTLKDSFYIILYNHIDLLVEIAKNSQETSKVLNDARDFIVEITRIVSEAKVF